MAHDEALITAMERGTRAQEKAAAAMTRQAQAMETLAESIKRQAGAMHALADAIASAGGDDTQEQGDEAPAPASHGYMDDRG